MQTQQGVNRQHCTGGGYEVISSMFVRWLSGTTTFELQRYTVWCTHMHTCTHTHTHAHTNTLIHRHTHAHTHMYTHTYTHTHTHTRMHARTHGHTHNHSHIHTDDLYNVPEDKDNTHRTCNNEHQQPLHTANRSGPPTGLDRCQRLG